MAGTYRIRSLQLPPRGGWWHRGLYNKTFSEPIPPWKCYDIVGNRGGDNNFTLEKYTMDGCYIVTPDSSVNYPVSTGVLGQWVDQPAPAAYPQINRILATSGPLTPNIYLPVSIFELRDIPRMLKHAGDLLHKIANVGKTGLSPLQEGAAATLAYQFGWAPLIQDIGKLLSFSDTVKKRQKTLAGAHTSRGINRRVILSKSNVVTKQGTTYICSYGGLLMQASYHTVNTLDQWATVRWRVTDPSMIGRVPTYNEALRTALGLNPGHIPVEVWKAIPWSWIIDWFADISNLMAANYNMVYYTPSRINVMTRRDCVVQWKGKLQGEFTFTGGSARRLQLLRQPQAAVTSFRLRLPFLDSFKLSVLGSLTILKVSRGG